MICGRPMKLAAWVSALLTIGCAGGAVTSAPAAGAGAAVPSAQATMPAPIPTESARELPDVARELEAARVTGTMALFDTQEGVLGCSDTKRCAEAVVPASTFKIAHSMIALETGLVEGPDTVMPWDKQAHAVEAWNRDLSFRDAFRYSCVPCYRALARSVGETAEREWVNKLDYGNHDTSGGVDKFWLWGGLRISPIEQIDFLQRFDQSKLPISERTAEIVRDIMTLDVTEAYVLRGKTGATAPPDEPRELAWFVGWLERGERRIYFALLIDGHAAGVDALQLRRPLVERVLKSRGLM
jgi:beta-lactamase class D